MDMALQMRVLRPRVFPDLFPVVGPLFRENFQDYQISVSTNKSIADAIEYGAGVAGDRGLVLVTGSLFVAAEVRETVLDIDPELYF